MRHFHGFISLKQQVKTQDQKQLITTKKFKNEGVVSKETVVLRRWGRANARNVSF